MSIMWKYLDKRKASIDALKDYDSMQFIIDHTDESIKEIQDKMCSIGSPNFDGMPRTPNPNAGEDRMLDAMVEIDVLRERYRQAKEYMDWFKPAWAKLTDEDRYVLEVFYDEEDSSIMTICNRFNIERTSAYKRKNRALEKLVLQLYGKE